jgi:hypothetical protein
VFAEVGLGCSKKIELRFYQKLKEVCASAAAYFFKLIIRVSPFSWMI